MCFSKTVYSDTDKIALVAEKDIKCYKILVLRNFNHLRNEPKILTSYYYYNKKWKLGKLYNTKLDNTKLDINICGPRHPFGYDILIINQGFHSYCSLTVVGWQYHINGILYECVIPKGATYYSDDEEYVSTQIKIVKKYEKSVDISANDDIT